MSDRIRIRYFESAYLQVVAVIQERSAHKKRAIGIDHDPDIGRLHHDVAIGGTIHEIHFVLQSGAASANYRHSQGPRRATLLFQERIEFARGVLGYLNKPLVTNLVIDSSGWGGCFGHRETLVCALITARNRVKRAPPQEG